jgi:NAD(P)-dependent dehydrogenase (short-subunit alcohol dehydrogenase family)
MFKSNPTKFSIDKIPNQTGKTCIVTGGNSGIGFQTCLQLAKKGAHVYLGARSEEKASEAIANIIKEVPSAKVTFLKMDLQDLKQIKSAAKEFSNKEPHLDILINNAGIMMPPFELTKDKIETQFGVNHVGHFLFTQELLSKLLASKEPRIVNLSSMAHLWAPKDGIMFDKINDEKAMSPRDRYGQSKLANLLFSRELNSRYGDRIYINSVHPGVVNTDLFRRFSDTYGALYYLIYPFWKLSTCFLLSPTQGALNSLYCATSTDIVEQNIKGKYFIPFAKIEKESELAQNDQLAKKLWEFTENLVNEKLAK